MNFNINKLPLPTPTHLRAFVANPLNGIFGPVQIPTDMRRIFDSFDTLFYDTSNENYPPFNVIKTSDCSYTVEIAVAGFQQNELEITKEDDQLKIMGNPQENPQAKEQVFLRRKLAKRAFKLEFLIGKYIEIKSATLENGILLITLEKIIPDQMKPIKINISSSVPNQPSLLLEENSIA